MRNSYYDQPQISPAIYPSNSNGLEARVKGIEVHLWHQARNNQEQAEEIAAAHHAISELKASLNREVKRAGLWLISTLGAAVLALGLMVLKLTFPGLFQ